MPYFKTNNCRGKYGDLQAFADRDSALTNNVELDTIFCSLGCFSTISAHTRSVAGYLRILTAKGIGIVEVTSD